MKSIRVSLIVYFCLLLALGLGAASVLVYRSAAGALREKQEVNRKLLQTQCKEREQEEKARFDERLLTKASFVASQAQIQFQPERGRLAQSVLLGLMNDSQAHLFAALWLAQASSRSPITPIPPS